MNTIIALSILSVLILFLGIYKIHTWMLPVLVIGLAVGLWFEFADWGHPTNFFHDMFITNHYTISFSGLMIICTLIISLMSVQYYENETRSMEGIYSIL